MQSYSRSHMSKTIGKLAKHIGKLFFSVAMTVRDGWMFVWFGVWLQNGQLGTQSKEWSDGIKYITQRSLSNSIVNECRDLTFWIHLLHSRFTVNTSSLCKHLHINICHEAYKLFTFEKGNSKLVLSWQWMCFFLKTEGRLYICFLFVCLFLSGSANVSSPLFFSKNLLW